MKIGSKYFKELPKSFLSTINDKWPTLIPVIITLISGSLAFYSGFISSIYNCGYYGVFSINSIFVRKDVGFINETLLKNHIDFIIVMILYAIILKKAYRNVERISNISNNIDYKKTNKFKSVFIQETISFLEDGYFLGFVPLTIILCVEEIFLWRVNIITAFLDAIFSSLFYLATALFFAWFIQHYFEIQIRNYIIERREYAKYRLRILREGRKLTVDEERIMNSFRIPEDFTNRINTLSKVSSSGGVIITTGIILCYVLGMMLIEAFYLGKMDAIYQKDYYITSDNTHVALPVSFNKYVLIEVDSFEDSLII